MCNLYHMSPKGQVERLIGQGAMLIDYEARHVGPFDTGLFLKSDGSGGLASVMGQWGMIRKGQGGRIEYKDRPARKLGAPPIKVPMLKNNARLETVHSSPAFREAWRTGQRCLIPANWLQEPNWETGKCIGWHLARADQRPWMIAGIYSEWADPASGELIPNYAMLTLKVNAHPLLSRLHTPEKDPKTGEVLPLVQQDKRGEAHIGSADFDAWLHGDDATARALLVPPPVEMFDAGVTRETDAILARLAATSAHPDQTPREQGRLL